MGRFHAARQRTPLVAALGVALAAFWWLAEEGGLDREFAWDPSLLRSAVKMQGAAFEGATVVFSFIGAGLGLLLLLTAVVFVLARDGRISEAAFVMSGLLLAQVVDRAVKGEVARPRPGRPDHDTINGLADLRIVALVLLATALVAALATRRRGSALRFGAIFAGAFLLYEIVAPAALGPGSHSFPSGHATSSMAFAAGSVFIAWQSKLRTGTLAAAVIFVAGVGLSRIVIGVHYPSDVLGGWALGLASVLALKLVWPRAEVIRPPTS
jgi:membrane-associated phospholipid phosphatase